MFFPREIALLLIYLFVCRCTEDRRVGSRAPDIGRHEMARGCLDRAVGGHGGGLDQEMHDVVACCVHKDGSTSTMQYSTQY